MNEQLSNLVQVNQELRQDLENLGKLYETVKTENARLAAELAEAKRSNESLVSDVRNHHEVAEQLRAELAALRAEARWEPVEDGEYDSFMYVDNGGKLLGIHAGDDYSDWYATHDLPADLRLCRLVPGQEG